MTQESAENLFFAICERAVEDYRNNLKIIDKTQSEQRRKDAEYDNQTIRKFLGDRISDMVEKEYRKTKVEIEKKARVKMPKEYLSLPPKERQKKYYELNKDIINAEYKELRKQRKAMGLCIKCGKNRVVTGKSHCEKCLRYARKIV